MYSLKNNPWISTVLIIAIGVFLFAFFASETFLVWAFDRHQNIASWVIRPLFLIPYCYFAYTKNLNGILFIILAIFTSMFWFPTPEVVDPRVIEFLTWEKEFLFAPLDFVKTSFFMIVILYFIFLARAFWYRSIKLGIGVVAFGAFGKVFGSVALSPETGDVTIPFALGGFIIFGLVLFGYNKYMKR